MECQLPSPSLQAVKELTRQAVPAIITRLPMFTPSIMVLGITATLAGAPDEDLIQALRAHTSTIWEGITAQPIAPRMQRDDRLRDRAVYDARIQPDAMTRFWLGGAVRRVFMLATPGSHLSMLGVIDFSVLSHMPISADISSEFGYRKHPISKRRKLHKGLDFAAPRGTRVLAAGPGEVAFAGRKRGYGNVVIISHGLGLETRYAHLHRLKTTTKTFVAAGELIGTVGSTGRSTGPHLHFEVRQFGEPINPRWALGMNKPPFADEIRSLWW